MPFIKNGVAAADRWVHLSDTQQVAGAAAIVVSFERWRRERHELIAESVELGVRLDPDHSPDLLADDLDRLGLVALAFPTFKDGRAFTYARLLRERYGFTGEVRAVGNVLRDQLQFMIRCGFDAFEIEKAADAVTWLAASREISVLYQPTGDGRPWAMSLRRQRQVAAE